MVPITPGGAISPSTAATVGAVTETHQTRVDTAGAAVHPPNECRGAATPYSPGFQPRVGSVQHERPEGARAIEWLRQ